MDLEGGLRHAGISAEIEQLVERLVGDPLAMDVAAEIERRVDSREGWIAVLGRAGELATSAAPTARRELCLLMGSWYLEQVNSPQFAVSCFAFVLGHAPDEPRALRGLVTACTALADPVQLEQALQAAAQNHPSPIERADSWIALAALAQARQDASSTEARLRAALESAPSYGPALQAFATFLREVGRAGEARDVLTELAFLPGSPAERAAVWLEIAALSDEPLGDAATAADAFRQALVLDPLNDDAARGLERHVSAGGRQDAIGLLTAELEANRTERERINLRYRLAALHEAAGNIDEAARSLEEILARAPDERRAAAELVRLYQALGAWKKLAETYLRQTEQTREREERVALFLVAADLYATRLGTPQQAIELSREALALAADDPQALEALARYSELGGDADRALEALDRCRRVTARLGRRANLWMRTAGILARRNDATGEEEALRQAVKDEPLLRDGHDRLANLCKARGDSEGAARHLQNAVELSESLERATRLADLAALELGELSQRESAADHFLEAAELRPDDLILAERVVQAQFEAGRPERAREHLTKLTATVGDRKGERSHLLWSQLAAAHRAAGDSWQELAALRKAHESDPRQHQTSVALADLYRDSGDHEGAAPLYERAWTQVEGAARGELALKAARARMAHGDGVRAATWFRRAYEVDPTNLEAMIGVSQVHRQRCEWRRAAELEAQIVERLTGEARAEALLALAELCEKHLRDSGKAAQYLAMAVETSGESRALLVRLLGLQSSAARWREALDTLDRLEKIEDKRLVSARINVTRARIFRDELKQVPAAAAAFEKALDLDPADAAGAFHELCAMWAQRSQDDEVCNVYRRMIDRHSGDPDRSKALCDELASILKDDLKDLAGAYAAYADAMALDPDNTHRIAVMADLAERLGNYEDALALHQKLVRRPPVPRTSLRALRRIFSAMGDPVGAGWAAAALVVLDEADEQDMLAFAATRDEVRPPQGLLSEPDWLTQLLHEDADPRLGKLLQIVAPAVHAVRALPGEDFSIEGEEPLPPTLENVFGWASSMLGVGRPIVRACDGTGAPDGIGILAARVPISVVGPIASRYGAEDCAFLVGHHLASYRAEHFLARMVGDPRELLAIALAAAKIVDSRLRAPIELTERVAAWAEKLYLALDPDARARLARVVPLLGGPLDLPRVQRWIRGAELTALRTGLLTSGDLCGAVRQTRRMHGADPALCASAIEELVAFAASAEHLTLRARLGQRTIAPRASIEPVEVLPPVPVRRVLRKAPPRPSSSAAM